MTTPLAWKSFLLDGLVQQNSVYDFNVPFRVSETGQVFCGVDIYTYFRYTQKTMVVRMRHTRSHTKNRRSHHTVASIRVSKDESGTTHVRHRMNPVTGKYRGREVVDTIAKKAKRVAKKKEKSK